MLVYFDVVTPATSSTAITTTFLGISGLFTNCHPATGNRVGCPAGSASLLVSSLQRFGLPLTNAFYNQESSGT